MSLRAASLLLAILTPLSAAAQQFAPASLADTQRPLFERLLSVESNPDVAGNSSQVVPLWASPDGRLLAIVALSHGAGAPTLPPSPAFGGVSDLRIIDATDLFSAGLRWRMGNGLRADMLIGRQTVSPISFQSHAMQGCGSIECSDDALLSLRGILNGTLGLGWTSPYGGFDLSFGLSWLDGRNSETPLLTTPAGAGQFDLAMMDVPGAAPFRFESGNLISARSSWQLDHGPVIDLTAGLARAQLAPLWYGLPGASLDLSQASLGLGIASGSLRGSIVGHVISIDDPSLVGTKRWSGLDLGVSWRTPWRGEVSVGAQNLWSAPLDTNAARDVDSAQARMPYVQYRQDL
jgi:hypothetical protein